MLYMAVEQSGATGSLALAHGTNIVAERDWPCGHADNRGLSAAVARLQTSGLLRIDAVDCFAVGVGPGAYTGLRTALAFVTACALPGRRAMYAVSSAEVLAWQLAPSYPRRPIMIVGDARRAQYWYRVFRSRGLAPVVAETDWQLCPPADLPWSDGMVVATADWDRIGGHLGAAVPANVCLLEGARFPAAAALARLTAMRMVDAIPSEPLAPIYLHSAASRPCA